MSAHAADEPLMHRALELARAGIGLSSPNPYVGAVITDAQGNVVGTGTHTYDRVKHAEVLALENAGPKARGGTLYINLEPCSHQGRTPPCAEALISAGIHRVVASMPDPNPQVSNRGFEMLRAAAVQVDVGLMQDEARRLNESFARYIRHHIPLVTLKSAMTLDGKIAPPLSEGLDRTVGIPPGGWITSEAARAHVQQLRHQHDAILVGVGTILSDNPLLTDRSGLPRRRPPLRVILDSRLRLPLDSRVVASAQQDLLVFYSSADEKKRAQLEQHDIRVEKVPPASPDGRPDLPSILRRLGELEITSVMIEGGSTVNGSALAAGVVDKVFLYYAPKIFGADSVPFVASGFHRQGKALQVSSLRLHRFAEDFAVEGYLRDPYQD
jgi:diaminohydroxyphosphoribosylaminopyrimidine deaminase/5-amino-6-(5-phosphoribosylamino)uracil reductase